MQQVYRTLAAAQDGQAVQNLARAANVDPERLATVFQALIPEFTGALERNTLSRGGLADFVKALGDGHHEYILDNPAAWVDPRVREDGNQILEHILGSKDRSRGVALRAAQASGLGESLIKMLLPFVAQMIMGAIAKMAKGGLGDVMRRLPGGGGVPVPRPQGGADGRGDDGYGIPWPGQPQPGEAPAGGGRRGGAFELPRGEMPTGGYPMPPIPDSVPGSQLPGDEPQPRRSGQDGGMGLPWPAPGGQQAPSRGGGLPFPFPFPFPQQQGGGGGRADDDYGIPWPRRQPQAEPPLGGGRQGGAFELPRGEVPPGGYPMPPIPGGPSPQSELPRPQTGGSPLPLPMPQGGGNNPYGDLSDILRRGGSLPGGGGGLGGLVRNVLGGLLGFGGRGVIGWLVRLLVMRFGWGLLKRVLGRMLTGR